MRKFLITQLLSLLVLVSFAEGYQVNLLSARQTGMGHTGVALHLGLEGMHFNPASLVFMDSRFAFSVGASGIFSTITYRNRTDSWDTDNKMGTPAYFYAGYKPTENLAFGLSFTTPYGSSLNWGKNWDGAHLVQDISLAAYFIQPTVSYKINDKFSVGMGLTIMTGGFELNKGLIAGGGLGEAVRPALINKFSPMGAVGIAQANAIADGLVEKYKEVVPASVNFKGDAEIKYGFNVGFQCEITNDLTIGVSYRSKVYASVEEGDAKVSYHNAEIKGILSGSIPPLATGTFAAKLPMPANTTLGVAYRVTNKLKVTGEVQIVGWSAYEKLDFTFSPDELSVANVSVPKNYSDAMIYRIGAEYNLNDAVAFRLGAYYDETPVDTKKYNPETPGMNKLGLSCGLSLELMKNFDIDMSLLYINGADIDGSVSDPNTLVINNKFGGTYSSTAVIPSIGVTYKF